MIIDITWGIIIIEDVSIINIEVNKLARKEFETLTPQMFYILVVLYQPMHGYEIMNEITTITNDEIKVGAGTLYTLLSRFLSDGYIELVDEVDRKKIYQITSLGKEKLQEEKRRIELQIRILNDRS